MVVLGTVMLIKNHDVIDIGAGAGKLEEKENVTQAMLDDIGIAEGQAEHEACVGRGSSKPHPISSKRHHRTDLKGYGDLIQQWITDG